MASDTVLAEWVILNPAVLEATDRVCQGFQEQHAKRKRKNLNGWKPDGLCSQICLTAQQVEALQVHLSVHGLAYDHRGQAMVQVVHQRHGDMVHMPPGHVRQVVNLQDCVKMAFDTYVLHNMRQYILVTRYLAGRAAASSDYMNVGHVLLNAISAWHASSSTGPTLVVPLAGLEQ